ncbi:putative ABC transporter permease [Clostridium cagae]|uniref:ABC transporter permease n=2 Tax=Clostridium TaxID=1485 RepID=B2TND4_CLOBB|nr:MULTISPECIES: putative ABC transporter permease [Clostridium]ACD22631.1 conserved hypothetical protein [Clostridium botulinum B str. Eklund 17B (NRP)]MBN1046019.1 hypothetical protein [Clostridium botulinum]MBN1052797.1 hypothetical protein [Clostridium botulinum]MBN1055959.1 hypothetical protein [Clostridium botulinum]MBY7000489.1 putative ABC transporter permease [Clostridium botulinum]
MHILNNFSLYDLVYFFMIYSFLGWCVEVIYAYKNNNYFINRGFLYGPFCPIYGFGIVFMLVSLHKFIDNLLLLFIFATLLTSLIEYLTGFILERVFKSKWWDYTDDAFNLHGRICLGFSLLWGAASVIVIKVIHPMIKYLIDKLPTTIETYVFYIIVIYFLIDFVLTINSLVDFKNLLIKLQTDKSGLFERCVEFIALTKKTASDKSKGLEAKFSKFILKLNHIRLIKSFPNVSSKSFDSILKPLKEKILKKD